MGFFKKCCLYLIPAIIASFAFATSFLFGFWCQSIKFLSDPNADHRDTMIRSGDPVLRMGPWYYQETNRVSIGGGYYKDEYVCVNLPSFLEADPRLKTVRAFTIITPVLGGMLTVGLWFAPMCHNMKRGNWKCLAICFSLFLTLFQGLTFLILSSSLCNNNDLLGRLGGGFQLTCVWDEGCTVNVVSTVLWFVTGIVMMMTGTPTKPPQEPPETQEVHYEQTQNPDGTTVVAETAVIKGTTVPAPEAPSEVKESA